MSKINEESAQALYMCQSFNKGNTSVTVTLEGAKLRLHGNLIAENKNNKLHITNAGWSTLTTKSRLNGCLERFGCQTIYQKAGQWFFWNGQPWNGEWINSHTV